MLAKVNSCTPVGLQGKIVEVEVDIANGLPVFDLVGLPDTAVRESRERVRAALSNSGYDFPLGRITVNLAPADIKKEGPYFDLAIAIGILTVSENITVQFHSNLFLLGELSLDGSLRPVRGVLSLVQALADLVPGVVVMVPYENGAEAALVPGVKIIPVKHLVHAVAWLEGKATINIPKADVQELLQSDSSIKQSDMAEVKGQEKAKRALEITAAGGHNLLFTGPPGSGKTMLARRLPSILPPLTLPEALETTKIYSVAGLLPRDKPLINERPFRSPHHTASTAGLIGGGTHPRPGEISLAHNGVLFMDEFGEFSRRLLDILRQPMEDQRVVISRAAGSLEFPADFILLASMNPCPCGFLGDPRRQCTCTLQEIQRYRRRVSGPILDRIDLRVMVEPVKYSDLEKLSLGESSAAIRERVTAARQIQQERGYMMGVTCNARLPSSYLHRLPVAAAARRLLQQAYNSFGLSARAHDRILRVSRTIADLAGEESVREDHIAEALNYRDGYDLGQ